VERSLVDRARSGDRLAFAELTVVIGDRLYALAFRIVRETSAAQDAVQQALLDAWRDLPSLRDPDRFDAWMTRLVVRSCYEEVARQRRFAASVRWLSPDERSSKDSFASVGERDRLEQALRRLSLDHRAVLVLRFYLDLPLAQVAERLEIPVGTARSRLHYAMRTLRSALEAEQRVEENERSDQTRRGPA
jgi:RNA polymerase sigma-70 factor (ECF subfamily)